ncbi:MAG: response regulator [Clostridiales bacterium]|jgi:two-component system response regulator YesN|nr:response regulator [Clostridiales bacterium]
MIVVDDEHYMRLGIKEAIDWSKVNVKIVAEACDGEEALELAIKLHPDLILTDIRMPFLNGLDLMEKLKENHLDCGVIVLSGYDEFEYAQKAIENGALAYLLKPIDRNQLRDAIAKTMIKLRKEKSSRNYYEMLKSELSELKRKFIINLLSGKIRDPDEIREKKSILKLPLEELRNVVVKVILDDYNIIKAETAQEEFHEFIANVEEAISLPLILNSEFIGFYVEIEPGQWCFIINLHSEENAAAKIEECCRYAAMNFENRFSKTISIGISEVCENIEGISECFRQATEAAEFKFLPHFSSIVKHSDVIPKEHRSEVREVLKFIKNHYYEDITVDMAAKRLSLSPSYIMHIFKEELGKTFITCLTECRIEAAKKLLQKPGLKIFEIASKLGYEDAKYFCRIFKKTTGLSPSEFRNEIAAPSGERIGFGGYLR